MKSPAEMAQWVELRARAFGKRFPSAMHHANSLWGAYARFDRDDGWVYAGYIAFCALLSFFPFLLLAGALAGALVGVENTQQALVYVFTLLPDGVSDAIAPLVIDITRNQPMGALTFSAVVAIWSASGLFQALRTGLNRAYGVFGRRSYMRAQAISLGLVLAGALAFIALALILLVGPVFWSMAVRYMGAPGLHPALMGQGRLMALGGILFVITAGLYRYLPYGRPDAKIWPGALLSTCGMAAAVAIFTIYLRKSTTYALFYGALGGVAATMMFFYVAASVFLFGAALNAELTARKKRTSKDKQEEARWQ